MRKGNIQIHKDRVYQDASFKLGLVVEFVGKYFVDNIVNQNVQR